MNTQTIKTNVPTEETAVTRKDPYCGRVLTSKQEALAAMEYLRKRIDAGYIPSYIRHAGCLEGSTLFEGDSVAIQRKMRGYND